jgi:hypothetical protein
LHWHFTVAASSGDDEWSWFGSIPIPFHVIL